MTVWPSGPMDADRSGGGVQVQQDLLCRGPSGRCRPAESQEGLRRGAGRRARLEVADWTLQVPKLPDTKWTRGTPPLQGSSMDKELGAAGETAVLGDAGVLSF